MYYRKRRCDHTDHITVEEIAEIAHLHRSTIEKYITLLLSINNYSPFVSNPSLAEQTIKNLLEIRNGSSRPFQDNSRVRASSVRGNLGDRFPGMANESP